MVNLLATRKILRFLPEPSVDAPSSDTALGDWYVNRIVVDRKPLLLLVCSNALLPMLLPAREVRALPDRLPLLVLERLVRQGIAPEIAARESRSMEPVIVGRTRDRSVVGSMVDFAKTVPYHLAASGWNDSDLVRVELQLARTPCRSGASFEQTIFPDRKAPELLNAKWSKASYSGNGHHG